MIDKAEILQKLIGEVQWGISYHKQKLAAEYLLSDPDDIVIEWHTQQIEIEYFKLNVFEFFPTEQ